MAILLPEARYRSGAIIAASRGAVKIPPLDLWDRDARIARRGGAVAQLGERRVRNAKVEGSIPFRSTSPDFPRRNNGLNAVSRVYSVTRIQHECARERSC